MSEGFSRVEEAVLSQTELLRDEAIEFLQDLIRIPTINPPGDFYQPCAELLGRRLERFGYAVRYIPAEDMAEHTSRYPRINVVGELPGISRKPLVHFNGHIDVVPAGRGWTIDPFQGVVRDGRIYGRGATDQKAGIVASIFAVEAIRRAGVRLHGTVEQSGTVDEESGGFAGVAYLARTGVIQRDRTSFVIITEPLNVDRICLGHRGVYWFKVTTRGRMAHGSMPFLGNSAIDQMTEVLHAFTHDLKPRLTERITAMPVEPVEARRATLNVNSVAGGQAVDQIQTACVADRCSAVFDRRFLIEEPFEKVRQEVVGLLRHLQKTHPQIDCELEDMMVVHPVLTDRGATVVVEVADTLRRLLGREPQLIASPGTYDQKHVSRIGLIEECIAYGPGLLHLAHQADEYCTIDDLMTAMKVMALATLRLAGH